MKEAIIVVTVLLLILGGSMWSQKQIKNGSETLIKELKELTGQIEQKKGEEDEEGKEDNEKRVKKSKEIYKKWKDINKTWSVIVLHEELDMLEGSLIKMKTNIKTESLEKALEELNTSIFLLEHISEKEKLSLKNIL